MSAQTGRLRDKVAAITGTGGGQGRAAALLFAREGALVVGGDLNAGNAEQTLDMVRNEGGRMVSMGPVDFADRVQVREWIDLAVREFGGIDVLYNNASAVKNVPLSEMSDEDYRFTIRNELDLVYVVTQEAWPHLAAHGGSVINVGSVLGNIAMKLGPGGWAHAATKGGVIAMTRELANEGGPHNIRFNVISPGMIQVPGNAEMFETSDMAKAFIDNQIVKRIGQPEDIARTALFLASDESSFITGQQIIVDGGYTVL